MYLSRHFCSVFLLAYTTLVSRAMMLRLIFGIIFFYKDTIFIRTTRAKNNLAHWFHHRLTVQTDEQEVINFLLTTEIIPLCLKIMESGSELSKTV